MNGSVGLACLHLHFCQPRCDSASLRSSGLRPPGKMRVYDRPSGELRPP
jgi:hypothetical protein